MPLPLLKTCRDRGATTPGQVVPPAAAAESSCAGRPSDEDPRRQLLRGLIESRALGIETRSTLLSAELLDGLTLGLKLKPELVGKVRHVRWTWVPRYRIVKTAAGGGEQSRTVEEPVLAEPSPAGPWNTTGDDEACPAGGGAANAQDDRALRGHDHAAQVSEPMYTMSFRLGLSDWPKDSELTTYLLDVEHPLVSQRLRLVDFPQHTPPESRWRRPTADEVLEVQHRLCLCLTHLRWSTRTAWATREVKTPWHELPPELVDLCCYSERRPE